MVEKKTVSDRVKECITLRQELMKLNIDHFPGFQKLYDDMNFYVKEGIAVSGKIYVDEIEREVEYRLVTNKYIACDINMKVKK